MKAKYFLLFAIAGMLVQSLLADESKLESEGDEAVGVVSLIREARFKSENSYAVIPNGFRKGVKLWTDRKYIVQEMPKELVGATLIQTPMEDRSNENDELISFVMQENCEVYVAVKKGRKPPAWLASWEETDLAAEASNSLVYLRKAFAVGERASLGNGLGLQAMYSVAVVKNRKAKSPQADQDGWVDLLEGDSLAQWEKGPSKAKSTDIGDRWSLSGGVLDLDRDAEKGSGGQIWTRKHYYDFELKFEFNIAHNGNSGIKYRAVDADGMALGCEYQIIDDEHYRDNKNPTHRTACLYELVSVPADRKLNPAGEWNTGRIRVSNDQFEHWLNGEKVMSIEFRSADWNERFAKSKYKVHPDFAKKSGPIVLTDHGDSVSYRNVSIRELAVQPGMNIAAGNTTGAEHPEPLAFTANCKACHMLDQGLVGPSLVEMSELYPRKDKDQFIQWTLTPGRKRDHLPQMPSMAHIPRPQLSEIYEYIKKVTVGVSRVKISRTDPFATSPARTLRPRIERTFVPESGPASLMLALPTDKKHNVIWDTDQCRLRYISIGETDNYPYLRSNGNSLASVGEIIYRESESIFISDETQFKGYHLSKEGFPSFVYQVGSSEVTETLSVDPDGDALVRSLKATPVLPAHKSPDIDNKHLKSVVTKSDNSITVVYSSK